MALRPLAERSNIYSTLEPYLERKSRPAACTQFRHTATRAQPSTRLACGRTEEVGFDQAAQWIDGDVPAAGWQELATDFLRRFKK